MLSRFRAPCRHLEGTRTPASDHLDRRGWLPGHFTGCETGRQGQAEGSRSPRPRWARPLSRDEVSIGWRISAVMGGHGPCVYGHCIGRNLRPFAILGLLLSFALVGAACWGDVALSKDDYITQGNAICEDANAKFDAINLEFANLPEASNPEEFAEPLVADFVDQFTAVLEEQLADLRALAAPEGDEDLLAAIYDDLEAVLRAIPQLAAAAAAGDPAAIEQLTSNEDQGHAGLRAVGTAFSDLDIRAGEYGLTVCGD